MAFGKLLGLVFIIFFIFFASFLAIHAFSTVDERTNVTPAYEPVYNSTTAVTSGVIGYMPILTYILVGFMITLIVYMGIRIFT
jgi:hypothetical protein